MNTRKNFYFEPSRDSANLALEMISLLKKWGLWKDVQIFTGEKCYTDYIYEDHEQYKLLEENVFVRHENNPDRYLTGFISSSCSGLEEKCFSNPEHLFDMTFEGPLSTLLRHHEYEAEISELSHSAKEYIGIHDEGMQNEIESQIDSLVDDYLEHRRGWDPAEFDSYEDYLSVNEEIEYDQNLFHNGPRDFSNREEYQEFISKCIESKSETLREFFRDSVTEEFYASSPYYWNDTFYDAANVAHHILSEIDSLFGKYGLWYELGFSWSLTTYRNCTFSHRQTPELLITAEIQESPV